MKQEQRDTGAWLYGVLDSGVTLGGEVSTDSVHTRRPGNLLPCLLAGAGQKVSLRGEIPGEQGQVSLPSKSNHLSPLTVAVCTHLSISWWPLGGRLQTDV